MAPKYFTTLHHMNLQRWFCDMFRERAFSLEASLRKWSFKFVFQTIRLISVLSKANWKNMSCTSVRLPIFKWLSSPLFLSLSLSLYLSLSLSLSWTTVSIVSCQCCEKILLLCGLRVLLLAVLFPVLKIEVRVLLVEPRRSWHILRGKKALARTIRCGYHL